jgi:hypothetical protein
MRMPRRLATDARGMALVEFAFVAPVMILVIMGLGDLVYQLYAQSILDGAVQKAGRDAAIEGGSARTGQIDARVMEQVHNVAGKATFRSTRRSYANFSSMKPEPIDDRNANGQLDPGECFQDINGNGVWDADPGASGQGGASDATVYRIEVTYPRIFPTAKLIGFSPEVTMYSQTVLKNQPWASQQAVQPRTVCT